MSAPPLHDLIATRAALGGVATTADHIEHLIGYYTLLERWNQKINLTALPLAAREPGTIDRLLVEPLIASTMFEDTELLWFDFGSGGGSPAIPLKVMRPRARLVMVEAKERKGAFLREAISSLRLHCATVSEGRIEELTKSVSSGTADIVTIRAVRTGPEVLDTARVLLKVHGRMFLFRGADREPALPDGFVPELDRSLYPSTGILSVFRRTNE